MAEGVAYLLVGTVERAVDSTCSACEEVDAEDIVAAAVVVAVLGELMLEEEEDTDVDADGAAAAAAAAAALRECPRDGDRVLSAFDIQELLNYE